MKKRIGYVITIAFMILSISALIYHVKPDEKLQWLRTDGRYIKNESGEIINLRGVAVVELLSEEPFGVSKYWGQAEGDFKEDYGFMPNSFDLLENSGVNCVRLSLNWFAWIGLENPKNIISPEQAEEYKRSVDTFINELNQRGIYVFIDFHTFGGSESIEAWQRFVDNQLFDYWNFWQDVARRYSKNPGMIGCELINEPRSYYDSYPYEGFWWDFMLETARKIHEVNPRLLIFVASSDKNVNGTKLGYPVVDTGYKVIGDQFLRNPLPEPNIVYVFHHYFPMEALHWHVYQSYVSGNLSGARAEYEEWLYKIAFRALDAGLPIINSEFNVKHFDYRTAEELPYPYLNVTKDLLELMTDYGCHWIWWAWDGSIGYPWDQIPDTNNLVYISDVESPIWNKLSKIGELWSEYLNK